MLPVEFARTTFFLAKSALFYVAFGFASHILVIQRLNKFSEENKRRLFVYNSIIGQIGHCISGNFNIHIWAWSASPSVQVGRL